MVAVRSSSLVAGCSGALGVGVFGFGFSIWLAKETEMGGTVILTAGLKVGVVLGSGLTESSPGVPGLELGGVDDGVLVGVVFFGLPGPRLVGSGMSFFFFSIRFYFF